MANNLYGSNKVKIVKIPAGTAYDLRDSKPITAGPTEGSYKGTRTPYARVTKNKGGSMKTFKQVQKEAMEFARKNDLSEPDAIAHLRRQLKRNNIELPSSMATDAEYKKQREKFAKGDPVKKKGGTVAKKKGGKVGVSGHNRLY